ncbi:hypothetical protein Patl1_03492 [Pistacia atlantica]|uniref:Uncharacterized protein n=1 Tax=Pistacia atlantica TaxID=434234 RepID=A0ACC1C516_9ROSI|nr:hypothetical protein Patl1_03492 [Pistacia atlantica]
MNQISAATIWIEGGEGPSTYLWRLSHALDRILDSRWFYQTGCFNALCPGFVQVHRKYYLGQAYGNFWAKKNRNLTHILVHRDKATGHWWVIHLGYWPEKLFTEFGGGANSVQFGGWTYGYPDGMSPPMGTGYFPTTNNLKQSGFFLNLKYVDDLGVLQDAHRLRQVADISNCYDAIYLGHKNRVNEQILTFGGPGGQCDL